MRSSTADAISKSVLHGRPLPKALETLWQRMEAGDAFLEETLALTLLTSREALAEGYGDELLEESEDVAANVRAHHRLFERLAFFAQTDGGQLLAFDVEGELGDDPPVVALDDEGQYEWLGASVSEAIFRLAEDADETSEAEAWLEEVGFDRGPFGELGSRTGHLPELGELHEHYYLELTGEAPQPLPTAEHPASPDDVLTWLLRPGPEVLDALRGLLGLEQGAYPEEQWMECDGHGRVATLWLHPHPDLRARGVAFGATRGEVAALLGPPTVDFDGERWKYVVDHRFVVYELEDDIVTSMHAGLDD